MYTLLVISQNIIPKNKKKGLCNSDNYRAIALISIISKIVDRVILIKVHHVLKRSNLQIGFKNVLSTTQCTLCMMETVNNYVIRSNVYSLLLDPTKAFDPVKC